MSSRKTRSIGRAPRFLFTRSALKAKCLKLVSNECICVLHLLYTSLTPGGCSINTVLPGRTQQCPSRKTSLEASLLGRTIVLQGRTIVLKSILPGRTIVLPVKLFHKHPKFLRGRTLLRPSRKARVYGTASRPLFTKNVLKTISLKLV